MPPPSDPRYRRGTSRTVVRVVVVAAVLGLSPLCLQGQPLPQWQLEADAEVEIGGRELPLHRVVGGALLESGHIAVVDAGNFQVLIVSRAGDVLQRIGTRGDGPGEFVNLARLDAFGDTLVMYDPALSRVTTARADGTLLGTVRLPVRRSSQTMLRAVVTPEQYVLSAMEPAEAPRPEPEVRVADVVSYAVSDGTVTLFRRRPNTYAFGVTRSWGYTVYAAPFLGETQFARWQEGYVIVPLEGTVVELRSRGGELVRDVALPIRPRPFDRPMVEAVRDSLLELAAANPRNSPSIAEGIREAYDGLLQSEPDQSPSIRSILYFGDLLWVERFPRREDPTVTWYLVNPNVGQPCAQLELPSDLVVLGGDERSVLLLAKTDLDEEVVRLHRVRRLEGCG